MSQTPTFAIGVLAEALPEGRSLTIGECAHAAEAAASVYDLDSLVDFEKGERTYTQLWRTPYSEAYAIGWKQAGDTGFHDHDGSVGAVHVVLRHGRRGAHRPARRAATGSPAWSSRAARRSASTAPTSTACGTPPARSR